MTTPAPRRWNVLFLCTHNSARSVLAECILRKEGEGRFASFSAGSQPRGRVNPFALKVLADHGYPVDGVRSKTWDEFAVPGAPSMDLIVTVCDSAAGEACPVWPGRPATAHWGIEDPSAVEGSDSDRERAFVHALGLMQARVRAFLALPVETMTREDLKARLDAIGRLEGASVGTSGATAGRS